jgi:hypothetical protein
VAFHPQQGGSPEQWPLGFPRALVDAAGRFAVSTYRAADGCPAGEYVVLVTWPAAAQGTGEEREEEEDAETVDRLDGRYATRESSPLTATVEPRPTRLPRFDLK